MDRDLLSCTPSKKFDVIKKIDVYFAHSFKKKQRMISKTDIFSLIQCKKNFPLEFSAREAWMLIHKKKPDVSINEFAQKFKNMSKEKGNELNDDALLEYYVDPKGLRLYSLILPDHCVFTSEDIIMKIRQVMCNLNESIQQNQLLSNDEDLNLQNIDDRNLDENNCSGDNKFMTEYEISKKMKIKEDRIRPFITILIELGIIIIENIELSKHVSIHHQKDGESMSILSQINLKNFIHEDNHQNTHFLNSNSNDPNQLINGCLPLGDVTSIHMINTEDDLSINIDHNSKNDINDGGVFNKSMNKNIENRKEEIDNFEDMQANDDQNFPLSPIKNEPKTIDYLHKRMLKWDESREMKRKNLSSSFEYLNNLRTMRKTLINLISKEKDPV